MEISKQTPTTAIPRNGTNGHAAAPGKSPLQAGMVEAQGFQIAVVNRLEALVTSPDGTTSVLTGTVEVITPAMATAYLAKMRPNRRVKDTRVAMWAKEMAASRWRPTNQGIAFDSDGYVVDGQHRLNAVVKSGQPAPFFVMRGLPREAQNVMDCGVIRPAGEQFNIAFEASDGKERVAIARVIHLLRAGWANPTAAISTTEAFRLVEFYALEIDWAMSVFGPRCRYAPAPVKGAWAYAFASMPEVGRWATSYVEGAGLQSGDPLLLLREYVTTVGAVGAQSHRLDMALKTARALWAKANGEPLRRLFASTEGLLGFARARNDNIAEAWNWHSAR